MLDTPRSSENMKKKHKRGSVQQQQKALSSPAQKRRLVNWPTPTSLRGCRRTSRTLIGRLCVTSTPLGTSVICIPQKMTSIPKISRPRSSGGFQQSPNNFYSADFSGLHLGGR